MAAVVMLVGYEQKGRAARCTVLNNKMIFFDIFVLRCYTTYVLGYLPFKKKEQ